MSQRLEAFAEILPTLPKKRAVVLAAIRSQDMAGATLADLVRLTGWQMHRLSGRVTELRDAGLLHEVGKRGGQTIWVACLPQEPARMRVKRRLVKARIESIEEADLFGRRRVVITIPSDVALEHVLPAGEIAVQI